MFTFLDRRLTLIGLVPEPRPLVMPAFNARLRCMSRFHALPRVGFTVIYIGGPPAKRRLSSRGSRGVVAGPLQVSNFVDDSQPEKSSGPGVRRSRPEERLELRVSQSAGTGDL